MVKFFFGFYLGISRQEVGYQVPVSFVPVEAFKYNGGCLFGPENESV